jgi:hypothetical protein
MLISEEYRKLNTEMHTVREHYGKQSSNFVETVFTLCARNGTTDVLDYGCGKGEMHLGLPFGVQNYDPAIKKYANAPTPADIVVCTDVLEHVEPECLDDVLADIKRCIKILALLGIPTGKARKTLPDGRNAHLNQHPVTWWDEKLAQAGFETLDREVLKVTNNEDYLLVTVK